MATVEEECMLINITKSKKDNQWQPRKASVEPKPVPYPRTLLEAMRIKFKTAVKYRDTHIEEAYAAQASGTPFIPEQDYCAVCTSKDRKCPSEFPGCVDLGDSEEELSECSNWNEDLEEQASEVRGIFKKAQDPTKSANISDPKNPARWSNGKKKSTFN